MNDTPAGDTGSTGQWTASDIPGQKGRTFIVTGANSGIGYETTRALAAHGAEVIMAVRNEAKGTAALEKISAEHPDADLRLRHLDLADLDSVHRFAAAVQKVDVLINNAGVMMPPRTLTKAGHELQFAVNHLGHFALTALLLTKLLQGKDPRVVTVSSRAHMQGRMHFDDLHGEHGYSRRGYYAQSKLANVVFGLDLHRRLRANGLPIRSVLAHPGVVATNLQTTGPTGLSKLAVLLGSRIMAQPAEMGALPVLYAATHPDVESGQFIGPDGRNETKGYPTVVEPLDAARARDVAKRLWELSEELTGIHLDLTP
ncbi:MAG TPA: oxidoreductase [Actinophytocola sp.]|uniref:oxidoreductase n=1 Tax=Actinophytocola sp. TaxID=1872138 RepID=UPI002DDCC0CE|nr:oxidoreductase [Actinophytocola sp.]HEV2780608.1 oxidoreductase [Actinophytocola sp.]